MCKHYWHKCHCCIFNYFSYLKRFTSHRYPYKYNKLDGGLHFYNNSDAAAVICLNGNIYICDNCNSNVKTKFGGLRKYEYEYK